MTSSIIKATFNWDMIVNRFLPDPDAKLCHYTTSLGFYGIMKSKKIWATKINYLNDYKEAVHGQSRIQGVIDFDPIESGNELVDKFKSQCTAALKSMDIYNIYVASFTEVPDQLSQWRGYSRDGGYCISFNTNMIREQAKKQGFMLTKCEYKPHLQNEKIVTALKRLFEDYKLMSNGSSGSKVWIDIDLLIKTEFFQLIASFKNIGFQEEQEWRLVSVLEKDTSDFKWRERRGLLVPYIEISLEDEHNKLPIDNIIVGPSRHPNLAYESAATILSTENGSHKIAASLIPFREF